MCNGGKNTQCSKRSVKSLKIRYTQHLLQVSNNTILSLYSDLKLELVGNIYAHKGNGTGECHCKQLYVVFVSTPHK